MAVPEHDYEHDPVWGDVWNPQTDAWAPSNEPFPAYGVDAAAVRYQDHGDIAEADPLSEQYGHEQSGSSGGAGLNLLTDVKSIRTAPPPPPQIVRHEVHTYETGAEIMRVRQVVVNGVVNGVQPGNLLEANPKRKRALLRILPADPAFASQAGGINSTGGVATATVPAGKTWTLNSIAFSYVASAAVATRTPRVTIRNQGGVIIYQWSSSVNLSASQVAQATLAPGMGTSAGGAGTAGNPFTPTGSLPQLTLQPGSTINIDAIGEDVADVIQGTATFTVASASGTTGTAVFIAPRDEGGAQAATVLSWWKLVAGDGPLELKTQSGVDVINENVTDVVTVQVYEELVDGDVHVPPPGIV